MPDPSNRRPFTQVDVFAPGPKFGNPVAVVHDAEGLTDEQMQRFANWTNLSETTFLLPPTQPGADYHLRIFTPAAEIPFAGHPTLGSAHAWLQRGGAPANSERIVQECGAGLVQVMCSGEHLLFAAPSLHRSGPVEAGTLHQALSSLGVAAGQVVASNWIDNGPGWLGIVLGSAKEVLGLEPDFAAMGRLNIGVIGAYPADGPADYEVRAFAPGHNITEDPVCGSVNAGFASWLVPGGELPRSYTVHEGTALGRSGLLSIRTDESSTIWVGGPARSVVNGTVEL